MPTWPAISTVADLLKRHDLVRRRRRRRPIVHPGTVPIATSAPNDLWTADFNGQFRTRDGIYCFPLTIADQDTRYLLRVQGCSIRAARACGPCSSAPSASTGPARDPHG